MASQCRIELLGGLRVIQGDTITERFQTQKTATLLAYLALHRGKKFPREQVAELLWPDAELTTIRNRLNQAVSSLRRQLHPPGTNQDHLIVADYSTVALRTEAFTTDIQAYDHLLTAASLAVEETERIRLLEEAMPLYKGEFLAGYTDDWVLGEQAMLAERQYNALSQLIKWYAQSGKLKQATAYATQRLESDPLDERSHRALMRLHLMAGHPRMAIAQYEVLDRLFAAEGLDPSIKAEKLVRQARVAAENTTEHSIEGLTSEDVTEFDASRGTDEPKASQKAIVAEPSATIPRYFTPYFGREAEIQQVSQLLQSGTRLVTITGVGGVGKTRLAVEVARRVLDQFEGRIVFVSLAGLRIEQQVADHCRAVIGGAFGLNEPSREELIDYLMSVGRTLVITDNAEEVDPAGIQRATRFIGAIPKLQVLMTSRRTVGMEGEVTVVVGMLPVPEVEAATTLADLMENPSVALLVNRARSSKHDFQLTERTAEAIVRLCRKLEGWPLAIELAAGWSRTLTVNQMNEQLAEHFDRLPSRRRDVGERHRSLGAVLDQSFELLTPNLRDSLMRLSVIEGAFDHETAEAVGVGPDTLDIIQSLGELNWLSISQESGLTYFHTLESVRLFVMDRAPAELRESARRGFCRHYVDALSKADPNSTTGLRVFQDYSNCIRATQWLIEMGDKKGALSVAGALLTALPRFAGFWDFEALYEHIRPLIEELDAEQPDLVARVRMNLAQTSLLHSSTAKLDWISELRKAGAYFLAGGVFREYCMCLISLGSRLHYEKEYVHAVEVYEEAESVARREGLKYERSRALHGLTNSNVNLGNLESARKLAETSVLIAEETGRADRICPALLALAGVIYAQNNYQLALETVLRAKAVLSVSTEHSPIIAINAQLMAATCLARLGDFKGSLPKLARSIAALAETPDSMGLVSWALIELQWELVQCNVLVSAAKLEGYLQANQGHFTFLDLDYRRNEYEASISALKQGLGPLAMMENQDIGAQLDRRTIISIALGEIDQLLETL